MQIVNVTFEGLPHHAPVPPANLELRGAAPLREVLLALAALLVKHGGAASPVAHGLAVGEVRCAGRSSTALGKAAKARALFGPEERAEAVVTVVTVV